MEGFESQFGKIKPQELEDSPFFEMKSEDSLVPMAEEVIELSYLTSESLVKILNLHEFKSSFTEQLSENEIFPFMQRIHDFEEKIKIKAKRGELMFGDNVIGVDDLPKFALYNILTGRNLPKGLTWFDLEDGLIEKFMRNGFSE
jgi:hypothetical protein